MNFNNFSNPSHYTVNTLNSNRSNESNFNTAFNSSINMIPQRNTKNNGNVIHNNINNNIVNEIITEYTIHIDSADRDIIVYPSPYTFVVSLGGAGKSLGMHTNISSNSSKSLFQSLSYSGVPAPRIDVDFKNVKYIKLRYIILPRNIVYDLHTDISGNISYTIASTHPTILSNYRYLIMRIKEIANNNMYSTNDNIKNDCFILYRDSNYYDAVSDLWIATQPIKIFYEDDLRNLNKLTIEILIPNNNNNNTLPLQPLQILQHNTSATPPLEPINIATVNGTNTTTSNFYTLFGSNILPSMEFELGICENEINTQKNYR